MRAAEGIRVQLHSRARSDAALAGEERRLRRTTLVTCLVALPPILLALRFSLQRVAKAWQSNPTEELVLIAIVLLLVPIGIVRSYRRLTARPVLPGQLWCSKGAIFSGPQDDDGGFEGSGEFVRDHSTNMSVPLVRLVLTASSILIAPGVTRAGRRDSGVTITRRDGRVAKFLFMPDKTLASELQRLGATVTQD